MVTFSPELSSLVLILSDPVRAASSYLTSLIVFPSMLIRSLEISLSPVQLTSKIFCPAPTILAEIFTFPFPRGRSHGTHQFHHAVTPSFAAAKNPFSHSGSNLSTMGFEAGV